MIETLKARVRLLRRDTYALYLAARDPRTPWYAKAIAAAVAAYLLSPIDLIPDFIPVLGYLDDLVLVPAGIWLALRLVPEPVMAECRTRAAAALDGQTPRSRVAAVVVASIWLVCAGLIAAWIVRMLRR